MKFILGKKLEMTQVYKDDGTATPVTKVFVESCVVTQVKTHQKDGYSSVQIGCGKRKKMTKPLKGHLKDLNARHLKEFRIDGSEEKTFKVGDIYDATVFSPGDKVKVTGTSKGKGFQGVVKRWGFSGSPASHGHKDQLRMPGSIGSTGPAHVFKGTKMGGRMGGDQTTISNLEVVETDSKNSLFYIKGAIPGRNGNFIWITGEGEMKQAPKVHQKETPSTEKTDDKKEDKKE